MEFSRFCRACASKINEACEIENNPTKPELPLLLKRYIPEFNIKVEDACLCFDCVSTLYNFHNFKRKCLRTEEDLRLHIRKHPEVQTVNFSEIFAPEEEKDKSTASTEFCYETNVIPGETIKMETNEPPFETIATSSEASTTTTNVVEQVISRQQQNNSQKLRVRKRYYQCDKCSMDFVFKKTYHEHLAYHKKPDAGTYLCKICNFVYHSLGALRQHNISKHFIDDEKLFRCEVCAKKFAQKWSLTVHMRKYHSGERAYKYNCSLCKFGTDVKTRLDTHVKKMHNDVKTAERYHCDKCSRSFSKKNKIYYEHLAFHEKPFAGRHTCKICNFVYQKCSGLKNHIAYKHSSDDQKRFKCEVCAKRFVEKTKLTIHMRKHTEEKCPNGMTKKKVTELPFQISSPATNLLCKICHRLFLTKKSLNSHMRKYHKRERYQCNQCSRDFTLERAYNVHVDYHKKPDANRFVCKICNFVYQTFTALNKHKISKHCTDDQKPFQCEVCAKRFIEKSVLTTHMIMHKRESYYQCEKCNRSFRKKDSKYYEHLAYHEKPDADRFVCEICNFVYQSLGALTQHNISNHLSDDQKPFQCEVCAKRFVEKWSLVVHMQTHREDKKLNSECQQKTIKQETIETTSQTITTTAAPRIKEICGVCRRLFVSKTSLNSHMRRYHQVERYQCDKCSRDFTLKNAYNAHLTYHERPNAERFLCKICNFVYHSSSALDKHNISKHMSDDQKPFHCEVCGMRFTEKSVLTVHMRRHTGEKPHKCPLCKFASAQLSAVYKHTSRKHNVEVERKFNRGKSVIIQKV